MSVHPISQAEADRVFSPADRAQAAKPYERQIANLKQRSYRMGRKASEAIEAWFSPMGTVEDILDYERAAEAQQLLVGQIAGTEAIVKGIIGQ
jgi:hypothetical protein